MKAYRKKPVIIHAREITPEDFDEDSSHAGALPGVIFNTLEQCVYIPTLEGMMRGNVGDFIIRGVQGELYPCRGDIFHQTYDEVTE